MTLVGHPLKDDPLLLGALADGLVAFLIEATAFSVKSGDPARGQRPGPPGSARRVAACWASSRPGGRSRCRRCSISPPATEPG